MYTYALLHTRAHCVECVEPQQLHYLINLFLVTKERLEKPLILFIYLIPLDLKT